MAANESITGWDRFWSSYPRRIGKGAAIKVWQKIDPDAELENKIILAIDAQKRSRRHQEDSNIRLPEKFRKFIPDWKHPATWLNQQCWEDEIPSIAESKAEIPEVQCCKCPKKGSKAWDCWVNVGNQIYCNRCWTEAFEDLSVQATSLSKLREAYKNRIPEHPGEQLFPYLKRALKSGNERMRTAKQVKEEARAEREAIQSEPQTQV